MEYSASRDGLPDSLKTLEEGRYGFTPDLPDWNSDGFGDLLMYLAGITSAHQNSLYCGPAQRISSANDSFEYADARLVGSPRQVVGLRDCEKVFLQLDPTSFDHDDDGIPDYLEIRAGLNPKNPHDVDLSIAGDGSTNLEKVKLNIPVDEAATSQPNTLYAYKYDSNFSVTGARKFTVSNIALLQGGLDNFIAIYIVETDLVTQKDHLFSAFMILPVNSGGRTIRFDFWGNDPALSKTNQEIALQ